eukprot:TRINITY_DN47163_c0_g1_i1.p1 TRINITY_DN47163_c0_g1~~TRINITY_DN47163_c0_g1_i1.p1  ORF type:complete len:152 (+),score=10.95 TRINITY_DN47163_c0_g1_i1:39-494(+)
MLVRFSRSRACATVVPKVMRTTAALRFCTNPPGASPGNAPGPEKEDPYVIRPQDLRFNGPGSIGGEGWGNPKGELALIFTCKKCNTRAIKRFSKLAYEKGCVIVECPGCDVKHLIADNYGWFGEEKNIEELMKKQGIEVPRGDLVLEPKSQ